MSNHGRNNLVTRFKCAKCDNQLELSYNKENTAKGCYPDESDKITGACKVEVEIHIEPCRNCVEEPQRALDTLRKILNGDK